mgnify:CR=1 FL=1
MIDLHMHTKYSDGTNTVKEILEKAQKHNLSYISITDHNTCLAYPELEDKNLRNIFSGKIIRGIEMNTKILGIPIEILGYGVDTNYMNENLHRLYISNKERKKGLGKMLLKYGIENFGINDLAVNEQNPLAKEFYEHMGFIVYKRTETDEQGNPYPLLYMKRKQI